MIKKLKKYWKGYLGIFSLFIFVISLLMPIFYMLSMSFKTRKEIMLSPLSLPSKLQFANYNNVIQSMDYFQSILNTLVITFSVIVLATILSSLAAYPLARVRGKIPHFVYIFITLGLVIPPFAGLTPLYLFMRDLGLLDSRLGLVIIYTVGNLPLGVFFYTSFMKRIPIELEEAARLDRANFLQAYWYVILPMLKPVTGTLSLFITLSVWNDVVNPVLFLTDKAKFTIMPSVLHFLGTYAVDPTLMFPAAVLASLPLIFLFLLLQKQIVAGFTAGAVKS